MIKTEFGLMDEIEFGKDDSGYEPEKYHCVCIDDDVYVNDWWDRLTTMKTYFHNTNRPETALARWGVTLIPPESLPIFREIVISDPRIINDECLGRV